MIRSPDAQGVSDAAGVLRTRAVLFDVDGTLYRQLPLRTLVAGELAVSALDPRTTRATVRVVRILRAYRAAHEWLRMQRVHDRALARLQVTRAAREAASSEHEVEAAVSEWMLRRPLKYLPACRRVDLAPTLTVLRRRGIRLGILSDYPARDKLTALGIADLFSLVLCTSDPDIGAFKPDPRGFWRACELWNVSPNEVLYVGDRFDVDAGGAAAAGLRSVILSGFASGHPATGDTGAVAVRRFADLGAVPFT